MIRHHRWQYKNSEARMGAKRVKKNSKRNFPLYIRYLLGKRTGGWKRWVTCLSSKLDFFCFPHRFHVWFIVQSFRIVIIAVHSWLEIDKHWIIEMAAITLPTFLRVMFVKRKLKRISLKVYRLTYVHFGVFFRGPEPWSNLILTKFNKCRNFHMAWRNVKCMTLRLLSTFIRFTANSLRRLISNLLNLKLNFVSDAAWIEKRIRFELKHSRSWYLIWLLLFSRF